MKLKGQAAFEKNLKREIEKAQNAAAHAGYRLCNDVINDSVRRVPVDTGALRGSHYVTVPEPGAKIQCEYGYGGPAKHYVVPVHENLSAAHEVGEAKFLEKSIKQEKPQAQRKLAKYYEDAYRTGAGNIGQTVKANPDG